MSSTTIISVWPGEKSEELEELRNAHGSAPVIWNEMSVRYLGCESNRYMWKIDELWPLYKRKDIPLSHRAVLTITYDNAIILKSDYLRAAADIRQFLSDFVPHPNYVNHWPRIAEILEGSPDCPAIGFHMTSVCENPFYGDWNEEADDYDQPDWNKFWSVYAELDEAQGIKVK